MADRDAEHHTASHVEREPRKEGALTDRRTFLHRTMAGVGALLLARVADLAAEARARGAVSADTGPDKIVGAAERFPHFQSTPVSYRRVTLQDTFWAPRQRTTREVSVPWIAQAHDRAGGVAAFKAQPQSYRAAESVLNMEAIKFIEAMATVVGLERDPAIEGLMGAWIERIRQAQGADGYLQEHFPPFIDRPPQRWQPVFWSHETYTLGHYLEAALAHREATGATVMYESAVRAVDNMVAALSGGTHAYTSGHPEIEQALMRLYGQTGDTKYLRLCGWLIDQRGNHEGRPSYSRLYLDDIPVKDQRTLQGHAVMAGYLFNGATHYVGATGDAAYREAVLAVWEDFVQRKMYLHGAGGNQSAKNEGYRKDPYCIPPDDTYGESCSVFANFQWAHSLTRLTGEARYLDTAERMLYNAFAGALSLKGDASFFRNEAQVDKPTPRSHEGATACCPPNIVKLINNVGGFFYSTDAAGICVNHYGASVAEIPWGKGVRLTQQTNYPWDGAITLRVDPRTPQRFTLRLRIPAWAPSYTTTVNGQSVSGTLDRGWLVVQRRWHAGDQVHLVLPMVVRRVTLPAEFKEYENRAALERGPIVYCIEEQDVEGDRLPARDFFTTQAGLLGALYIPEDARFEAEYLPDLLGGVTVLRGEVRQLLGALDSRERTVRATFIPYGVWGNRTPGPMRIWLGARKAPVPAPLIELLHPNQGDSCVNS